MGNREVFLLVNGIWQPYSLDDEEALESHRVRVAATASLGEDVCLGDGACIQAGASIGDDSVVGAGAFVGSSVLIGRRTSIGDLTSVFSEARVGDDVHIGAEVRIGHDVVICDNARVGYRAEIANHAKIGNGVFVPGRAMVGDGGCVEKYPRPTFVSIIGPVYGVHYWGEDKIAIGCQIHSIDEWLEEGEEIAKTVDFGDEEIAEYRVYVETIKAIHEAGMERFAEGEDQ
jgi:UDP-3-O-[3-hydroxymyristoyl] glucosamine N-acyltransferase